MSIPTKTPMLIDREDLAVTAPLDISRELVKLASDPNFDAAKLASLIAMYERAEARDAKAQFTMAFTAMQADMPTIAKHGAIVVKNEIRSRYSKWEDMQRIIGPIWRAHGFSLNFRNAFPDASTIEVTAVLRHAAGHSEENPFRLKRDASGSMNDNQGMGSSQSYGMRYAAIGILNIVTCGTDDDGQASQRPDPPDEYEASLTLLSAAAAKGQNAFRAEWNSVYKVRRDICEYVLKHDKPKHEGLKAVAQGADRKAAQ